MMHKLPAVIFAGGKSSRMGRDKALLPFDKEKTLSQYQYKKMQNLFAFVYLSAKENKFDFACEIIKDRYPESSPLVGIVSLFETLVDDAVFILSVDAPLVNQHIINTLIQKYNENRDCDAIIAESPEGIQPLCGIYSKSILPLAKSQLSQQDHRLRNLLDKAHTKFIPFNDEKAFINLNTPEEYNAIF